MPGSSQKIVSPPIVIVPTQGKIDANLQQIWTDIRNGANGISAIGLVSRIGFPISTYFTTKENDDDKCAAMVSSVVSVSDRLGIEFESLGSFKQSIFTNANGFLLFYDIGNDSILFCIVKSDSNKLGLINYLITQKIPLIKSLLDS